MGVLIGASLCLCRSEACAQVQNDYILERPSHHIGQSAQRQEILKELHDEMGHRGWQGTYNQVSWRYQWKGMYEDVINYVKTCEECQRRARIRYEEPLQPTWSITMWEKVGIDVVCQTRVHINILCSLGMI